jgi:outer membrane protein OmpA-like peptidoglycan-associated protein
MLDKSLIYLWTFFILTVSVTLSGCGSSKNITADNFQGSSKISKGDTATISWYFKNADRTLFEGINKDPQDSIKVAPEFTTDYRIDAISDNDTLSVIWKVEVENEIESIPNSDINNFSSQSFSESEYLIGVDDSDISEADILNQLSKLKVLAHKYEEDKLHLNLALLDRYGNQLTEILTGDPKLSLTLKCSDNIRELPLISIDNYLLSDEIPIDILIDDSGDDSKLESLIDRIIKSINTLNINNEVNISFLSKNDTYNNDNINIPIDYNLNNSYSKLFNKSIEKEKLLIYINSTNDNSSLIYTPKDIVLAAKDKGTSIYILQSGNEADPMPLRYISSNTAGTYYNIDSDINDILKEIVLGRKYGINAVFNTDNLSEYPCDGRLTLNVEIDNSEFTTFYNLLDDSPNLMSSDQILALFEKNSIRYLSDYSDNIKRLAETLKDNPGYKIQLLGHSGVETSQNNIALERAKSIKDKLILNGIDSDRINIRDMGNSKPMYPLESSAYQSAYNRRVEVRWITPLTFPYEIHVESADSENIALEKSLKWEDRGYRVYYDRYMESGIPYYKVLLWGYRTEKEALEASARINDNYGLLSKVF